MTKEDEKKLLEMAEVFHMPKSAVREYITMPSKFPKLAEKSREKKYKQYAAMGKIISRK
jgi:hypothetical protein